MNLELLQDRRTKLASQIRALAGRQSSWSAADRTAWDTVNASYDTNMNQLNQAIEAEKSREGGLRNLLGRDMGSNGPPQHPMFGGTGSAVVERTPIDKAIASWGRNALGYNTSPADDDACRAVGLSINSNRFNVALTPHGPKRFGFVNSQQEGFGSTGGFLTSQGFIPAIERAMLSYSGVLQVAEVITTESGNRLSWPTNDDTANIGTRVGEGEAADLTMSTTFGRLNFDAFTYTSGGMRVSRELLDDAQVDLASYLGGILGERIGRKLNVDLTTGVVVGNGPIGIVTASTLGTMAASATAITLDDILALMESVDPAYRPSASFMIHSSIVTQLRKLKDGMGHYLWENSTQADKPSLLFGYPVYINQAMDSTISSGKKTVLFGDLSKYKVRRVGTLEIRRLVERFAEYHEDCFLGYARFDGGLLDAGTHPIKYLQH